MPRVKPERKAARRAQILDAARARFARDGFHRTTLQEVFASAGLSAGCVYNYFKSKDELILAIADGRHRQEQKVLSAGVAEANPADGMLRIVEHFVDEYLRPQGKERRQIAIQTWAEALRSPAILAVVRDGFDGPRRDLVALVRRGQADGVFDPDLKADAVARAIIAIFHGFVLQGLWASKLDVDACRTVFERFLGSLSAPPVLAARRAGQRRKA